MTRLRYRDAAKHFKGATAVLSEGEGERHIGYLEECANALYRQGTERVDSTALPAAVAALLAALEGRVGAALPRQWAQTMSP